MPRLDRFLQALVTHGGESLRLAPGRQVQIERGGSLRPVSREVLDALQVTALIRELAPPSMVPLLRPSARLNFTYHGPTGPIDVELAPVDGGSSAVLRRRNGPGAARPVTLTPAEREAARREMESLLREMVERDASDLHLRAGEPPTFRKDGDLQRADSDSLSGKRLEALIASIMPDDTAVAWAAPVEVDWAWQIEDVARFRCHARRELRGPAVVIRRVSVTVPTAEELGLSREVQTLAALQRGLVLVAGPSGSGKTTLLAALADVVNTGRSAHLVTIEHPIEYVHKPRKSIITQHEVGRHTATVETALSAALREDADVVLVDDLPSEESWALALELVKTGRLVLAGLPTASAVSTVDWIIDQFPPQRQAQARMELAGALRGVITQVLCRRVGGGRVPAREVLIATPAIGNLIRENKTFQIPSVMQIHRKAGMVTLNDALLSLVDAGQIEPREAHRWASDKAGLVLALQSRGHDTDFPPG